MSRGRALPTAVALGLLALALGLLAAACGAGSSAVDGSPGSTAGLARGTEAAAGDETAVEAAEDPVLDGVEADEIKEARFPNGKDNDEISTSGAKPIKPCALVRRSQASAILGARTRMVERPLGPTCVYSAAGRTMTLAVEGNSLGDLRHAARRATGVTAAGRRGYCLHHGTTAAAFALGGGRALHIGGPCPAGVRFAAIALKKLSKQARHSQ